VTTVETTTAGATSIARGAAEGWAEATPAARAEVLRRGADALESRVEELALLITRGVAKPITEARAEARRAVTILRFAASLGAAPMGRMWRSEDAATTVMAVRGPVGVVALITPFNFPAAIPAWKLAPALVAGNAVLLKPSPPAVECARLLAAALAEAGLPEGVLHVLDGDAAVGESLVADPGVDAVSFTGSAGVGRSVAEACVRRGARLQLELGGKNTAIVLADADLERAARDVAAAAYGYAGQKCTATSRVLVHRDVAGPFTRLLARATEHCAVGDPEDATTVCGPVIAAAKRQQVAAALQDANVVARGSSPDGERWVAPVLVADAADGSPVWSEELFAPVLAVRAFATVDEAFATVNRAADGLANGLYTTSSAAVHHAVRSLRSGVVAVNRPTTGLDAHVPFGGIRQSGAGPREQGPDSLDFYTEERTVYWREEMP
jgi:acyl-CoA reductase-like NAD-dependent aldehyde dehydrogenase